MSRPAPGFAIRFDAANPGHALACCGLLELAYRLWGHAECWFDESRFHVAVADGPGQALLTLVQELAQCQIAGLSDEETQEREDLEAKRREARKQGEELIPADDRRRRELGEKARKGDVALGRPFDLRLDWWNDDRTPKTWAGQQEIAKIARFAQDALANNLGGPNELLDHADLLPAPFYFDSRRFVHALDTGFSVDAQGIEAVAHPGVELLALIGLQRFRPVPVNDEAETFDYWIWHVPLGVATASACFAGCLDVPRRRRYRFSLRFRDDRRRYKAFGFARPYGGET